MPMICVTICSTLYHSINYIIMYLWNMIICTPLATRHHIHTYNSNVTCVNTIMKHKLDTSFPFKYDIHYYLLIYILYILCMEKYIIWHYNDSHIIVLCMTKVWCIHTVGQFYQGTMVWLLHEGWWSHESHTNACNAHDSFITPCDACAWQKHCNSFFLPAVAIAHFPDIVFICRAF